MWKLSITTSSEAEDAVTQLLGEVFGGAVAAYRDFKSGAASVAVFCRTRPAKSPGRLAELRNGLARIKACGLRIGRGKITLRRLPRRNWAESWKRHFKPIEVGDTLLIKPRWSKQRSRKGQAVVLLDPGLSFGTGHHPTTLYCLRELVRQKPFWERSRPAGRSIGPGRRALAARRGRSSGPGRSFLDLGTGSGILAIAAAKLGYAPVHAIDFDPESIRAARANARANRVSGQIRVARQDLAQLPPGPGRRYDLICANLLSTLLLAERTRIVRRLKPGGVLVLAGILKSEFNAVARRYKAGGLRLTGGRSEKEWRSGTFRR